MSKTGKHLGKFIVGSLMTTSMILPAHAQSIERSSDAQTDPVFTQAVQQTDTRSRTIDDLSSPNTQRTQLLGANQSIDQQTTQAIAQTNTQQRAQPATAATPITNPDDPDESTLANNAVDPVQTGTAVAEEADPFDPTGIRLGTYDLNVSLEQAIGYSSNVSEEADGEGGAFSDTSVSASITSNWSRHQWQTNINGSYRRPFDDDEIDQPELLVDTALRLDLIDGYTLTTRGFYNISTQGFTSSTLAPGAVDNPIQENWGGSVELERTGRKLQLTLRGDVDRDEFQPADLGWWHHTKRGRSKQQ